jgi:ribose transport system substrate-binding protein
MARAMARRSRWASVFAGITASAFLGVASAGCGAPASQTTAKQYTIGLSTFFEGNSYQAENVQLFLNQCKAMKSVIKKCFAENGNSSVTTQLAQLQAMVNEHVSAIVLDPGSTTAFNGVVQKAISAGIPVIVYNDSMTGKATTQIEQDDSSWGTITAQWLVQQLHGQGNIIVLNGVAGNPNGDTRYLGAAKVFAANPGIHILQTGYAAWDQATAETVFAPMLTAYPNIDGVWSQGGAMTAGAMLDMIKAGRKLVPMTGEDYNLFMKMWLQYAPTGFTSIAPADPNWEVTIAVVAAVDKLEGKTIPKAVAVPLPIITAANATQYYLPNKASSYWTMDSISNAQINKYLDQK